MPGTGRKEIAAVEKAAPADFEKKLLDTLIAHQDDAVQLAKAEVIAGRSPQVKLLAERIEASRTGQIRHMLHLLGQRLLRSMTVISCAASRSFMLMAK